MRWCRFNDDRLGVVDGDDVIDATYTVEMIEKIGWPRPLGDPLIASLPALTAALDTSQGRRFSRDEVRLGSVLTSPSKIMAAPANYRRHVEIDTADPGVDQGFHRAQLAGLEHPVESLGLFLKATSSLAGPADGVLIPRLDRRTDYEVELAVVIGALARDVPATQAWRHVAGYCLGLDMSVRGTEDRSFRKSGDTFTVLGPWLTTPEHVPDPHDVTLRLSVNGELRQHASTSSMTVGVPRLIELASAAYTLYPGDVLLTGTPEGVGPVEPGDVLVAGADELGEMTVAVRGAA